jgi:hypothetical protein
MWWKLNLERKTVRSNIKEGTFPPHSREEKLGHIENTTRGNIGVLICRSRMERCKKERLTQNIKA